MTYDVLWSDEALAKLDAIWRPADDKEGVEHLAIRANLELGHEPCTKGESRDGESRVLFKLPLVVWFEVYEATKQVIVLHIRFAPRRK